jgi:hypothetical protein
MYLLDGWNKLSRKRQDMKDQAETACLGSAKTIRVTSVAKLYALFSV